MNLGRKKKPVEATTPTITVNDLPVPMGELVQFCEPDPRVMPVLAEIQSRITRIGDRQGDVSNALIDQIDRQLTTNERLTAIEETQDELETKLDAVLIAVAEIGVRVASPRRVNIRLAPGLKLIDTATGRASA